MVQLHFHCYGIRRWGASYRHEHAAVRRIQRPEAGHAICRYRGGQWPKGPNFSFKRPRLRNVSAQVRGENSMAIEMQLYRCNMLPTHRPCRAPIMTEATPTSSTTALLTANPPSIGGPYPSYTFIAIPVGGGPSLTATCQYPTGCPMTSLKPNVLYDVSVVGITAAGGKTPPSVPMPLEMPSPSAPTFASADATGPTTGTATAAPPKTGGPWTRYTFTATPLGGGTPVVVTSDVPRADFTGLQPGTRYMVDIVASGLRGDSPTSNTLTFMTPSIRCVWEPDAHGCKLGVTCTASDLQGTYHGVCYSKHVNQCHRYRLASSCRGALFVVHVHFYPHWRRDSRCGYLLFSNRLPHERPEARL